MADDANDTIPVPTDVKAPDEPTPTPNTDDKPPKHVHVGELVEWKKKAKAASQEAEQLRQQVQEYQDRNKSDLEKAQEATAKALADAAKFQADNQRIEAAIAANLPLDQRHRLVGDTPEELLADAQQLKAAIAPAEPPPPRRPAPDPSQGARPESGGTVQLTEADIRRMTPEQVVEAQSKGQLNEYLGIT